MKKYYETYCWHSDRCYNWHVNFNLRSDFCLGLQILIFDTKIRLNKWRTSRIWNVMQNWKFWLSKRGFTKMFKWQFYCTSILLKNHKLIFVLVSTVHTHLLMTNLFKKKVWAFIKVHHWIPWLNAYIRGFRFLVHQKLLTK